MTDLWSQDWTARVRGANCPACVDGRPDRDAHGIRVFSGSVTDAYLQKAPIRRGHTSVIWRGRHVAEPTELESGEAIAYWREVMQVGSAIQDQYQPAKMNYLTLGNAMPHLHTHIVPRPWDDPEAAGPFRFQLDPVESSEEELVKDAIALSERLKQDL